MITRSWFSFDTMEDNVSVKEMSESWWRGISNLFSLFSEPVCYRIVEDKYAALPSVQSDVTNVESAEDCRKLCSENKRCVGFQYFKNTYSAISYRKRCRLRGPFVVMTYSQRKGITSAVREPCAGRYQVNLSIMFFCNDVIIKSPSLVFIQLIERTLLHDFHSFLVCSMLWISNRHSVIEEKFFPLQLFSSVYMRLVCSNFYCVDPCIDPCSNYAIIQTVKNLFMTNL